MSQDPLHDLQSRIAHQEVAIDALNRAIARQDRLLDALGEQLAEVKAVLRELQHSPLGRADEPPPPHY